ncbi:MAG: tetratricopeptide repeat protein [bacterium]
MLLPCPCCKESFRFDEGKIRAGRARLKCPACGGLFLLQNPRQPSLQPSWFGPAGSRPEAAAAAASVPDAEPMVAAEAAASEPAFPCPAGLGLPSGPEPAVRKARRLRAAAALWILAPVCGLLLAVLGILMPVTWKSSVRPGQALHEKDERQPAGARSESMGADPQKTNSYSSESGPSLLDPERPGPAAHSVYLLLGMGAAHPCKTLAGLEQNPVQADWGKACTLYPYWIAFLSSESQADLPCSIDSLFSTATEAVRNPGPCPEALAFLTAYYVQKKVPDRSQAYLDEARQLAPNHPWVRWTEALFHLRISGDRQKGEALLKEVVEELPDFQLARYLLAKAHIRAEEYQKAEEMLVGLSGSYPQYQPIGQIRTSLASIVQSPYYSQTKAYALLQTGKAFLSLQEYPMAEELFRRVLEGMPGKLSSEEEKTAFLELGRLCELRGDKEGAYRSYQDALRVDPMFPEPLKRIQSLLHGGEKAASPESSGPMPGISYQTPAKPPTTIN